MSDVGDDLVEALAGRVLAIQADISCGAYETAEKQDARGVAHLVTVDSPVGHMFCASLPAADRDTPSRHGLRLCPGNRLSDSRQLVVVRQVERQGRDRDMALLEGPEIRSSAMFLDRHDHEPVMLAAHRIGVGNDRSVVVVDSLRRPSQPAWLEREVDVDEPGTPLIEQRLTKQ